MTPLTSWLSPLRCLLLLKVKYVEVMMNKIMPKSFFNSTCDSFSLDYELRPKTSRIPKWIFHHPSQKISMQTVSSSLAPLNRLCLGHSNPESHGSGTSSSRITTTSLNTTKTPAGLCQSEHWEFINGVPVDASS